MESKERNIEERNNDVRERHMIGCLLLRPQPEMGPGIEPMTLAFESRDTNH